MDSAIINLLARCQPLSVLGRDQLTALLARCQCLGHERGRTVAKSSVAGASASYLVRGSVELRRSFFDRVALMAGDALVLQPIERLLAEEGGQLVAGEECVIVSVEQASIDRQLAAAAPRYAVDALAETLSNDELRISDSDVEGDWMAHFLQSPLAAQLPPTAIQQLLACLQSLELAAGAEVVRRGEPGDAIYVVMRGSAAVLTDSGGAFEGREISLMPGDYFGEESLVADTVRNATVVMASAGAVARLGRQAFDELIRPYLVRRLTGALPTACDIIDVRFPLERRSGAHAGSRNVPIPLLRARLHAFAADRPIAVTAEGGCRAELAVFLLRQAGYDAWLLADGVEASGVEPTRQARGADVRERTAAQAL